MSPSDITKTLDLLVLAHYDEGRNPIQIVMGQELMNVLLSQLRVMHTGSMPPSAALVTHYNLSLTNLPVKTVPGSILAVMAE